MAEQPRDGQGEASDSRGRAGAAARPAAGRPRQARDAAVGGVRGPLPAADERHQRAHGRSRRTPQTTDGKTVAPVVWEAACLEEVCGSCTMVINGKVRQACSRARRSDRARTARPITLEPMTQVPAACATSSSIAQRMFEDLKRVKAWIDLDGTHELGPGPRESPENQEERYPLSRCMTCGCCLEACPQYNDQSTFIGPGAPSARCASSTCTRRARCTRTSGSRR